MAHNKKLRRPKGRKTYLMRVNVPGHGQREFSTGEKDYGEALKVLQKKEAEIADGATPTKAKSRFTLEAATALIEADYELNERSSTASMLRKVKHLTDYFGAGRKLSTIDTAAWTLYQRTRKQAGAAAAEINRERSALRRMFTLGKRTGLVSDIPHLPKLPERNRRTGFFEYADYVRVRRKLALDLRPILDLMYYTGWRLTESTGVELRQVTDGWIRLDPEDSKEESGKAVPYHAMPPLARSIGRCLREHAQLKAEGIVATQLFVRWFSKPGSRKRGRPIKNWRDAYNTARTAAGVDRILHDTRRTAARTMARARFPVGTAKAVTGHKTDEMWDRYNIQTEADVLSAFRGEMPYNGDIRAAARGTSRGTRTIGVDAATGKPVRLEVVSRGRGRG